MKPTKKAARLTECSKFCNCWKCRENAVWNKAIKRNNCPACQGTGYIETGVFDAADNEIIEPCDMCGAARKSGAK